VQRAMKLIVAGASGFVASEVIRQSLLRKEITSVVALARKPLLPPTNLPEGADVSKFRSVVVKDYGDYPDDVRKEFAGAGGCVWYVACCRVLFIDAVVSGTESSC
jgi:hypothetical protein